MYFTIAIDGPVGVGKSSTARYVARELGVTYIDTGAMYRAVAYYNVTNGTNLSSVQCIRDSLPHINIEIMHRFGKQRLILNGEDVTEALRTPQISEIASMLAGDSELRKKLVQQQRELAARSSVVMDGRDIGSHVLPNAHLKIYLDATAHVRASRRLGELRRKGHNTSIEELVLDIEARDLRDKTREIAPLVQAESAVYIDTSNLAQREVTAAIVAIAKERCKQYAL